MYVCPRIEEYIIYNNIGILISKNYGATRGIISDVNETYEVQNEELFEPNAFVRTHQGKFFSQHVKQMLTNLEFPKFDIHNLPIMQGMRNHSSWGAGLWIVLDCFQA